MPTISQVTEPQPTSTRQRIGFAFLAYAFAAIMLGLAAVAMLWIKEPPIVRDVDEVMAMPGGGH